MKVAFYLDYTKDDIDYSDPKVPNPGIGGTQYLIWTISYYLSIAENGLDVTLFSPKADGFPKGMKVVKAESTIDCVKMSRDFNIDLLVLRGPFITKEIINAIEFSQMKTIVWSHNFENYVTLKNKKDSFHLIKNVCVSYEQYDLLKDTSLYNKTTVIHNGINFEGFNKVRIDKKAHRVCYIGNLYPKSGFDKFALEWKKIEKVYPNAELFIIGGNNLYDYKKMKSSYSEKSFSKMNKIIDESFRTPDGEIKENIHFTGVLGGEEKLKIMASSQIGIANITEAGDTFGLSAVEFQALGVPVISLNRFGVRETVQNGNTGLLVDSYDEIPEAIIELFENKDMYNFFSGNTKKFVQEKFSIDLFIKKWEQLLNDVETSKVCINRDDRYFYDGKKKILINSKIKKISMFKGLPPILFYQYLKYGIIRLFQKMNLV